MNDTPSQTTRKPPPMQMFLTGWWVLRQRRISTDALVRFDASKDRLRHRPLWRGLSRRWRRV